MRDYLEGFQHEMVIRSSEKKRIYEKVLLRED